MSNRARVYLDHNATTPLHEHVREAMAAPAAQFGNPSSIHAEGRAARALVEQARRQIAAAVDAATDEIVFTSGGTEADVLGMVGLAAAARARGCAPRVVTPPIEHPAVLGAASYLARHGFELLPVRVDGHGRIELDHLEALCSGGVALVSVALANHELGTVQPIADIAALARAAGALVFCDAVQAFGKVAVNVGELGVDGVAVSSHKIYGPKGVGALWIRREHDAAFEPPAAGGHQERERRGGTENVSGIVGMGAAAARVDELLSDRPRIDALGQALADALAQMPGVVLHGGGAPRLAGTVNVRFEGAPGDVVCQALDLAGFAVSTGAACTSGSVEPSKVLLGVGLSPEQARSGVRFSFGTGNTAEDVKQLLEVLPPIIERARRFG